MVVSTFSVLDKDGKERFFEEFFLMADVKPVIVLGMFFLTMNNIDIDFQAWNLQWRSYTTRDVFPTTKQVELVWKKKFATAVLALEHKIIVIYVTALSVDPSDKVHHLRRAQMAHLKVDDTPTKVLSKYADFADVFSQKLVVGLSKHTRINDHIIEFVNN